MSEFFLQLLNGLTLGGIYALIALGYTMVYGIIKLINFAHGEIFMVGAFMGLMVAGAVTQNFIVVIVLAMLISAAVGILVEKTAYRPLRDNSKSNKIFTAVMIYFILIGTYAVNNGITGIFSEKMFWRGTILMAIIIGVELFKKPKPAAESSRINALISAIGMSFVLLNVAAKIYGHSRANYPQLLKLGNIDFAGTTVSLLQFFIIFASLVLMGGLYYVVHKTKIGLAMRAVSQNTNAARLMGINPNFIISCTFAIGSALAAAAGVLVGIYYTIAEPTMGSMYGLKAFVAAVLGGIGSIPGAMVGGFILGVAEIFGIAMTPYFVKFFAFLGIEFSNPNFKDAIAFGILIFILIIKPAGIFGSSAKEKV